eukprot:352550-Chlamydomonas_euryale.AAC.7
MVAEQTPSEKLQSSVTVGALVTFAAVVISTLCHSDPYGEPEQACKTCVCMYGRSSNSASMSIRFLRVRFHSVCCL